MRQLISILTLCIGISLNADAQTFTQRIQKRVAGQGSVTIHQDSVIDRLVNTTPLGIKTSTQTNKPSQPSSTSQTSPTSQANKTTPTNSYSQPITSIPDTVDTSKKIIRGYKINGYSLIHTSFVVPSKNRTVNCFLLCHHFSSSDCGNKDSSRRREV